MSEPSLAAQRLAVATARAYSPLVALVPAANIFDRNERPEVFPCVLVGEGQTVADEADCLVTDDVFLDFHIWTRENGLAVAKEAASALRRALRGLSGIQDGIALDFDFVDARFLRDPGGELAHAIVSFRVASEDTVNL